jgi:ADP-ribose pyrophosphatase YjhB (NUDIX family)
VSQQPVVTVGGVVIKDGKLLMIRRKNDPGRGLWSIPGGRLELGEYLSDAVAREVFEETGVRVETRGLLGIHEVTGDPHYVMLDHVAVPINDAEPVAGDDADDVRWVPIEDIDKLECTPLLLEKLRDWGAFD